MRGTLTRSFGFNQRAILAWGATLCFNRSAALRFPPGSTGHTGLKALRRSSPGRGWPFRRLAELTGFKHDVGAEQKKIRSAP